VREPVELAEQQRRGVQRVAAAREGFGRAQRRTSPNAAISSSTRSGTGLSRTVTSVTTPSMPSDPVSSASSGRPGASPATEPSVSHSPSMVATRASSRLWTVSPCFRQCTPPEFSATLPPIVQATCEDGSGA
jgi:hypothetical protein